jgi:hypothetical protein
MPAMSPVVRLEASLLSRLAVLLGEDLPGDVECELVEDRARDPRVGSALVEVACGIETALGLDERELVCVA